MTPGFVKWKSAPPVCVSSEAPPGVLSPGEPALEQLRTLTEISRALTYTTSFDQVTRLTVDRGAALLSAKSAVLMLADEDDLLHVRATHGIAQERIARFSSPFNEDMIDRLQGLLDVPADAFLAVPLVVGGAVSGLIAVAMTRTFTRADEWLLSALADQVAVALETARLGGEVRLEMEARLRHSESTIDAKDRALSTLAHDIRTPLGAIEGYCDLIADEIYGPINDRQREAIGRVRTSGRHLLGLLDNVLDMARLNAGVLKTELEPVVLNEIARDAVMMVTPAATARLQTLEIVPANRVVVCGNNARVRQVLVNLISNAVKFTPEHGSILIEIKERRTRQERVGEIVVRDSGPGIAHEEHASIFEPYYRSASAASSPGVGLGLAISSALMVQMGGSLLLESEPNEGSSFIVRLPIMVSDCERGS